MYKIQKTLLILCILGIENINSEIINTIPKVLYKKEAFQGDYIYFASNKNFKRLSLLSNGTLLAILETQQYTTTIL